VPSAAGKLTFPKGSCTSNLIVEGSGGGSASAATPMLHPDLRGWLCAHIGCDRRELCCGCSRGDRT
jgi:hypothetical protein